MTTTRPTWHDHVFFGIHYDLHAHAGDTELGRNLTHAHLRERLLRVGPDWIQCDCKGHPGYTSWPTLVGSPAPGIVGDALRVHRDVTRDLGIKLSVHYSGVWDSRAIELHPAWGRVDAAGQRDPDITCRLSDYDDQLMIPQMIELVDRYDVDGFWVDGENWAARPCWCERCRAEFTRRTAITDVPTRRGDAHWQAWMAFHRDLFVAHVTRYTMIIHDRKPACAVVSNWMYTARQPEPVVAPIDYISGDYDWVYGADRAAIEGRVIDSREMSWDLMAWSFSKTGTMADPPPWVMKSVTQLQQELAEVVALGGAVMVYNQPQRSGWLPSWHQDLIAEAAAFCRDRQAICWGSRTVPEAAVLHLDTHYYAENELLYAYDPTAHPVEGALHALLETHHSTDVLTRDAAERHMIDYKLIVVPEHRLDAWTIAALEAFATAGGHVLLSGTHLTEDAHALVGATPRGAPVAEATFLEVEGRVVPVSGPWQPVTPSHGTESVAYRLRAQEPERDRTDQVIVTRRVIGKGAVTAVHGPIFGDYYRGHYLLLRRWLAHLVAGFPIAWTVAVTASPRLEVILRRKEAQLLVNLINRGAGETLSPHRVVIDELPPVTDVVVHLRCDACPSSVVVEPGAQPADWDYHDGMVTVRLPRIAIHAVVVVT